MRGSIMPYAERYKEPLFEVTVWSFVSQWFLTPIFIPLESVDPILARIGLHFYGQAH